jgi:hypothetical protein
LGQKQAKEPEKSPKLRRIQGTLLKKQGTFVENQGTFLKKQGAFVENQATLGKKQATFVENQQTFTKKKERFMATKKTDTGKKATPNTKKTTPNAKKATPNTKNAVEAQDLETMPDEIKTLAATHEPSVKSVPTNLVYKILSDVTDLMNEF